MQLIEKSYYDILTEQAAAFPDRDAVVMGDERLSYRFFADHIDGIAGGLISAGLQKGDLIALWAGASPQWLCCYYGIIRAGGVAVVLNANLTVKDASPLITYAECKAVLYGSSHDLKGLPEEAAALAEACSLSAERVIPLDAVPVAGGVQVDRSSWNVHDDAYVIFTSGTTAFPKAVASSQFAIINSCARLARAIQRDEGRRAVMAVPLFHAYGLMVSWIYLQHGGTILIPDRIKADSVAEMVERENATDLWSVAVIYQGIIDNPLLKDMASPRLELCTIAGSYTTPVQFARYESNLKNACFINMYGMTETCAAWCLTRPQDDIQVRYNTVGTPIEDIEMAIIGSDGKMLPAGQVGEILTRGFHLKNSYLKLPPEKQAVDADGWLHTGDLGVVDEQGNLQIVGRTKDLIIKGGENIAPAEVEAAAMDTAGVKECRVFGCPDRIYGENLSACIVPEEGVLFDEDTVRNHIKNVLGSYKTPVHYILFDKFPLNANGKVDQRLLHIEMLQRIRQLALEGKLSKGVRIISVAVKNSAYSIMPVAELARSISENLGFSSKGANRIRLSVEEMMSLRVNAAGESIGDITMEVECFHNFLRLTFHDPNLQAAADEEHQESFRISIAIVTRMADDISIQVLEDGTFKSHVDFAYDKEFNIFDFLMKYDRDE